MQSIRLRLILGASAAVLVASAAGAAPTIGFTPQSAEAEAKVEAAFDKSLSADTIRAPEADGLRGQQRRRPA